LDLVKLSVIEFSELILLYINSTFCECRHYGAQAVVVSVDPKRVYVASPEAAPAGMVVARLRVEQVSIYPSIESAHRGDAAYL
jgi:imidazole glycerol phosphate synthase subunit HisF